VNPVQREHKAAAEPRQCPQAEKSGLIEFGGVEGQGPDAQGKECIFHRFDATPGIIEHPGILEKK